MFPRQFRHRILTKAAQYTPPTNLPTGQVAATQSVIKPLPNFTSSDWYPSIVMGFGARNMPLINGLTNILNAGMHYSSNGYVNMSWMRQVNWQFDPSMAPDVNLKNLMLFSKQFYDNILTNLGQNYAQQLTPQQIQDKLNILRSSQYLGNLSATQPSGQLASKIGGNLREMIKNYLLQIK